MTDQDQIGMVGMIGIPILYMMPSIIALWRGTRGVLELIVFNVLFGWSIIGWFICMFLAAGETRHQAAMRQQEAIQVAMETRDRRAFYRRMAAIGGAEPSASEPGRLTAGPRPYRP